MLCSKCKKEFEPVRPNTSLPEPTEVSFNFSIPNQTHFWLKKFTVCPNCAREALKFFEEDS